MGNLPRVTGACVGQNICLATTGASGTGVRVTTDVGPVCAPARFSPDRRGPASLGCLPGDGNGNRRKGGKVGLARAGRNTENLCGSCPAAQQMPRKSSM